MLVRETGDSVWVKDDRETNANDCLVMAANMVAWRGIFIGSCSRRWWSNPLFRCNACDVVLLQQSTEEGARDRRARRPLFVVM